MFKKSKVVKITSIGDKSAPNAKSAKGTRKLPASPGNSAMSSMGSTRLGSQVKLPRPNITGSTDAARRLNAANQASENFQNSRAGKKMARKVSKKLDRQEARGR